MYCIVWYYFIPFRSRNSMATHVSRKHNSRWLWLLKIYILGPEIQWLLTSLGLIDNFSTLSSSKLGLAAGSSALSPPEMLFRTWGGRTGRSLYPKDVSEGGWCRLQDCIYLTARPESSKNTHPGTGTAFGGRKPLPKTIWVLDLKQGGREIGIL